MTVLRSRHSSLDAQPKQPLSTSAQERGRASQPTTDEGGGGLLGGLGGLLDKLQKGGLGDVANSWIGSGQNKPVSPGQLGPALGPDIIKTLAQRSGAFRGRDRQAAFTNLAGSRRQADPQWAHADVG